MQTASTTTAGLYYLHRDHLGSILMITDITGAIKEKRQFDAWGNIVKLEDGAGNALTAFVILDRGYTGHEHLLGVGLINMNGRLYDPILHRFLSPDDFVQDPANSQNFNRYAYVLNNPLRYTDLDGNWALLDDAIAALAGGTINLISNALQGNVHSWSSAFGYFGVGAASGVATLYGGPLAGSAVLSFGNSLVSQVVKNGWSNVSLGQLATSTALGVGTSWAGGLLGNALAPAISGITSSISSPVISQAVAAGISNAATGFALGTGVSLISGKSFADALSDGASAAASGAGMGFITGGISGYKYAKDNDLGIWSGRSTLPPLDPGRYAGVDDIPNTDDLVRNAKLLYPDKADKIELHHIEPKYLGGPKDGPVVPINASYHQVITNEFRVIWKYGIEKPSSTELQKIMIKVYTKYPLPKH